MFVPLTTCCEILNCELFNPRLSKDFIIIIIIAMYPSKHLTAQSQQ